MASKPCDLCGVQPAGHVCKACGSEVCDSCFDHVGEKCLSCSERSGDTYVTRHLSRMDWVSRLFLVGFAIIFVGMLLMMVSTLLSVTGSVSGGGFILIGPIPFGFWFGPGSPVSLILVVVLLILGVFLCWMTMRRRR